MKPGETKVLSPSARQVAVAWGPDRYETPPPYSPSVRPPEYPFDDIVEDAPAPPDHAADVYGAVRESLQLLGLDEARFGTADWNPLGELIAPGETVVLKPNFVRNFRETHPDDEECLITHGSVLRAAVDYVYIALEGRGRVIIADAPQNDAEFSGIRKIARLDEIEAFYAHRDGFSLEVRDLRPECARKIDGVIVGHQTLPGDPAGYVKVNLGTRSAFMEVNHLCHLLYGAEYDRDELHSHQHDDVHEYLISKTILDADCVISLPKLKTHKKTGMTVNLKNLVGINGNKNWLPHHREGTPSEGGDQFAEDNVKRRIERRTVEQFKRVFPWLGPLRPIIAGPVKAMGKRIFGDTNSGTIRSGNWHGNDTTWRMVLDLNRILYYADAEGKVHDRPVRKLFSIVDGIIAGEGNGPLDPNPKHAGVIVAGWNPVAVDLACASLMGFDRHKLPLLYRALEAHPLPLTSFTDEEVRVRSGREVHEVGLDRLAAQNLAFEPHFGWVGHVELDGTRREAGAVT